MRIALHLVLAAAATVALTSGAAHAAGENPDFRIRADFRIADTSPWGDGQSIGHADFRIQSRFMQVYYGGVSRLDEFKFQLQFDYTGIAGYELNFPGSVFDNDYDVYIGNAFVGRVDVGASVLGLGELAYDSRHATLPTLPLPAGFPEPVNTFDLVSVFVAGNGLPTIGSALPTAGTLLFSAELVEEFARGDVDQDGKVDGDDFAFLAASYDPFNVLGPHIGPANGDFTGDNRANLDDYNLMALNWTSSKDIPGVPQPVATIPEPGQGALLAAGLTVIGWLARRKQAAH